MAVLGAGRDSCDQGREHGIGWRFPSQEIGVHHRVLYFQQPPERLLLLGRRCTVLLVDVTGEQHVQLPHPPPAAPAQLADLTAHQKRRRWAMSCLISAMAFAGFKSFGHASVQFMMVWQRYRRKGSSSWSRRSPVASSRLSTIQR